MTRFTLTILLLFVALQPTAGQQVADSSFHFPNPQPAFPHDAGPVVCIDAGHLNFHTMNDRYYAFAELLRGDGFRVQEATGDISASGLAECDLFVIANAYGRNDDEAGAYPHESAFEEQEIGTLLGWARDGGGLLLIADHSPWPGAVAGLGAVLGVQFFEGQVSNCAYGPVDEGTVEVVAAGAGVSAEWLLQRTGRGELGQHPILEGRNPFERPGWVFGFGGSAFYPAEQVEPLLILGPDHVGITPSMRNVPSIRRDEVPRFPLGGWLQAGAVVWGEGRAVILAEAAMCSAQIFGASSENPVKRGMNNPMAAENPRFCLNVARWLAGLLPASR